MTEGLTVPSCAGQPTGQERMATADRIRDKLTRALAPSRLEIVDESHLHKGHAGAREGGETHFRLLVVAERFTGLSRVERHRLVNAALAEELADRVHALAMRTLSPDEASAG